MRSGEHRTEGTTMAVRIERNELGVFYVGGIPCALSIGRGRRAVIAMAGYDADGLLESADDVLRAARHWQSIRPKLDKGGVSRKDDG
jgi:hypothetical protein